MQTEFLITKLVPREGGQHSSAGHMGGHSFAFRAGRARRFDSTHRRWALLDVIGLRVGGHIGEQRGPIQGPGVLAAGNLRRGSG